MIPGSVRILTKTYVFDPRPRLPLQIVAKRHWIGERNLDMGDLSDDLGDTITPVFLHGAGCHKEHWDLTIQRLFEHQQSSAGKTIRFRDMWSLDLPNHGDSAVVNEETLLWGFEIFPWEGCAQGVHAFLAGLGTGVDVDFSGRRLALVGHSMGGAVAILATTYRPSLRISSLHLIEPFLIGEGVQDFTRKLPEVSDKRRDIWPSSEDAFQSLRTRPWLHAWDERILKIATEHGLRPLPTAEYPDLKEGVTLKCTRKQEAATYRDRVSCGIAYRHLPYLLNEIPTHITQGMVIDLIPEKWQRHTLQIGPRGISNFASVTKVSGAGHMVVQSHPDVVADIVWKSLIQSHSSSLKNTVTAKL